MTHSFKRLKLRLEDLVISIAPDVPWKARTPALYMDGRMTRRAVPPLGTNDDPMCQSFLLGPNPHDPSTRSALIIWNAKEPKSLSVYGEDRRRGRSFVNGGIISGEA